MAFSCCCFTGHGPHVHRPGYFVALRGGLHHVLPLDHDRQEELPERHRPVPQLVPRLQRLPNDVRHAQKHQLGQGVHYGNAIILPVNLFVSRHFEMQLWEKQENAFSLLSLLSGC